MSKMRVQLDLIVPSTLDGETVRTAIETDLAARDIFDRPVAVSIVRDITGLIIKILGHIRFNLPADAQAIFDAVQAKWTAGALRNLILVGSRVSIHDCPHDEPEANWTPCNTRSFVLAVK